MDTKKNLTININLDGRILAVLLIVVGVLFWAYARAGAQAQGELDTNSPEARAVQEEIPLPSTQAENLTPPEPGMLPTTNGEWIFPNQLGKNLVNPLELNEVSSVSTYPRHAYLTSSTYATNAVLTACISGYHMASMWEILDVSNLVYDYNLAAAYKRDDSGYGPPSDWNGWVRTGVASSGENTIGTGNCKNWTSVAGTDYGVSVRLSRFWQSAPGDLLAWDATNYTCNYVGPVWCIKN